ncbi:MAG: hypothetical protein ABFC71_04300 [Methanoregula sp.]
MVLEGILDASVIFIFLVILGFIVSSIFRTGRYFGISSIPKTDNERLLEYVSTAIFFLVIFFIFLIMMLNAQSSNFITDFITPFFLAFVVTLGKFSISQDTVTAYLALLFWISVIFMFVYIVIFSIGRFIMSFDENYIEVTFIDTKDTYRSVLSETDDFIFFETIKKPFLWVAIRKENIKSMKSIRGKSLFNEFLVYLRTDMGNIWKIVTSKIDEVRKKRKN